MCLCGCVDVFTVFWYYKHKMNPQNPQQPYSKHSFMRPGHNLEPHHIQPDLSPQATIAGPDNDSSNPYEFILNPEAQTKKSAPGGDSNLKRGLMIISFLVVLTIIGWAVATLLMPKDTSGQQMIAVAQEQQELVRVASAVAKGTNSTEIESFATTVQMTVDTNRQATMQYLAKRDIKTDAKILALKQDSTTDKNLETARATNSFDRIATQTLKEQLAAYQTNLKKAYATTTGKNAQALLQASYDTASALIAQGATVPN